MAITTAIDGRFISISYDGAADWDMSTYVLNEYPQFKEGMKVHSIQFVPNATDDKIIIRNSKTANQTSPIIMQELATSAYDIPKRRFGGQNGKLMWPSMDAADCTDYAGNVVVIIELAG